jgi:hypothetical protein
VTDPKRAELRETWRRLCDLAADVLPSHGAEYVAGGRSGVIVVVASGEKEKLLREIIAEWKGEVEPDPEDPSA